MDQNLPLDKYKTVQEAADILGLTRQAIVKAISRGDIQAERKGNIYLIANEQIEAYRNNPLRSPRTRGSLGGRPKQR